MGLWLENAIHTSESASALSVLRRVGVAGQRQKAPVLGYSSCVAGVRSLEREPAPGLIGGRFAIFGATENSSATTAYTCMPLGPAHAGLWVAVPRARLSRT